MSAEVGKDGQQRAEEDMGLDIDPKTGHAYESQGDATNESLGLHGRFHNGMMVPRVFQCANCQHPVTESAFGRGFENCGLIDLGPGGKFNLCPECILRVVNSVPRVKGLVAAMNGGELRG